MCAIFTIYTTCKPGSSFMHNSQSFIAQKPLYILTKCAMKRIWNVLGCMTWSQMTPVNACHKHMLNKQPEACQATEDKIVTRSWRRFDHFITEDPTLILNVWTGHSSLIQSNYINSSRSQHVKKTELSASKCDREKTKYMKVTAALQTWLPKIENLNIIKPSK